ncbi:PGF-pre-PGF domain-containing protein [Halobellus ruber]|uniref:PGF-pre-PGF domain-containing protein n=1 Tax=Halobellus ruber TaxID=2761102 RepID=A0A7J9SG18_9EURY|nr:PGF-pre-PGF domain-containing protein [Halobellus ruber]MBB6645890.1 PGF-pre-PGF domain-containing protein [Halobellus ruber]
MTTKNILAVAMVALAVVISGGAAVATAQEDPPGEPASFYGSVEDADGTAAPTGTTIYAVTTDEEGNTSVEGSITVETAGQYGGSDATDDKLRIDSGTGTEVRFHVNSADGPQSESTYDLDAGVYEQDLTFPAGTFENAEAPADGGGGSAGAGGGAGADTGTGSSPVSESSDLDDGSAEVNLSDGISGVTSVRVTVPGATGEATVEELNELPEGVSEPEQGERISTVDISAPDPTSGPATVRITISQSRVDEFNAQPENLRIVHYTDGGWQSLDTTVASRNPLVLAGSVDQFSPFAVIQVDDRATVTATPTLAGGTQTPTPAAETGTPEPPDAVETAQPTSLPAEPGGFDLLPVAALGLVAVIVAAVVILRRRG